MKFEPFLINPLDESIEVNIQLTLAELKYVHGLLVDLDENAPLVRTDTDSVDPFAGLLQKLNETIVHKMKEGPKE